MEMEKGKLRKDDVNERGKEETETGIGGGAGVEIEGGEAGAGAGIDIGGGEAGQDQEDIEDTAEAGAGTAGKE